jgi:hypothetical protein
MIGIVKKHNLFLEGAMKNYSPLSIVALGTALTAALIVLFLICLVSALAFPDLPAAQGWAAWLALFTVSPTSSPRVLIDGFGFSLVFGWVTAVVLGFVYNRLISR